MGLLTTAFLVINNIKHKLFSNVQLIKDYIVIEDDKEDGEMKCEKADSQKGPVGISTVHSSTCKRCTGTQPETLCHLFRKGRPWKQYKGPLVTINSWNCRKNEDTCLWKLMFWRHPICLPSLRKSFASTEKGATSLRVQFSWDTQLMGLIGFQNALWPSPHGWHHRTGPVYPVHLEHVHTAHSWFIKTRLTVFASLPVENPEAPLHSSHNKQP